MVSFTRISPLGNALSIDRRSEHQPLHVLQPALRVFAGAKHSFTEQLVWVMVVNKFHPRTGHEGPDGE